MIPRSTFNTIQRSATLLGLVAALGGCSIGGLVLSNVVPPADIPAVYQPIDQPTAVVIDDPAHHLPSIPMLGLIADRIGTDLEAQQVISTFVSPKRVDAVRLNHRDFADWPIDRIGRELGAQQVIYVLIADFALTDTGNNVYRPIMSGRVKIIDVASGTRLFPSNQAYGHPVTTKLFFKTPDETSRGSETLLARKLIDHFGKDIGKLFYDHRPRQVGRWFDD